MYTLYVNNFRGFKETTIPLLDTNFFVGENSTGKTSLLALLSLLIDGKFWLSKSNFNSGAYKFGGFKDLVSIHSSDRSEFQVGLGFRDSETNHRNYILLHFKENQDGLPKLTRLSLIWIDILSTIRITDKQVSVRTDLHKLDTAEGSANDQECFQLLREAAAGQKGYKRSLIPPFLASFAPVVLFQEAASFASEAGRLGRKLEKAPPFPQILSTGALSLAPIRTMPKRTYDGVTETFTATGEHTPYVIRKKLQQKGASAPFVEALEEFGRQSGLFESIGVSQFGRDTSSPFELTVTLSKKALRLNSVGYGVSQALPIIVELLTARRNTWLLVQQPEVHLHPKAQAALGDLFSAYAQETSGLVIETHSDYLIDRFRMGINKSETGPKTQVIYFERSDSGNSLYPMVLDEAGEYPSEQPTGFRSFFLDEEKRILGF